MVVDALQNLLNDLLSSDEEAEENFTGATERPKRRAQITSPAVGENPDIPRAKGSRLRLDGQGKAPQPQRQQSAVHDKVGDSRTSDSDATEKSEEDDVGFAPPCPEKSAAGEDFQLLDAERRSFAELTSKGLVRASGSVATREDSTTNSTPSERSKRPSCASTPPVPKPLNRPVEGEGYVDEESTDKESLGDAVHLSSHISPEMLDPGGAMPVIEVAPQHNLDLEAAEENESILANSKGIHGHIEDTDSPTDPIDCLRLHLQWAWEEWHNQEQVAGSSCLGSQLLIRMDPVLPLEEALAKEKVGEAFAIAGFRSMIAVGTAAGVCQVLMPKGSGVEHTLPG